MASSSSATDVEATCFYTARAGECHSSAVDGVAVEGTQSEYYSARHEAMMKSRNEFPDDGVALEIEFSKTHWTEVTRPEVAPPSAEDEALTRDSREVLRELRREPEVAPPSAEDEVLRELGMEHVFGNIFSDSSRYSYVKLGARIAEGGQAEIYEVEGDPLLVLKVFKRGTSLRDIRRMWPLPVVRQEVLHCIRHALVLDDGRFALVLHRHWGDLRKLIDQAMLEKNSDGPPFPYRWNGFTIRSEDIMCMIAIHMRELHSAGVFHRDLKASNILLQAPSHLVNFLRHDFACYPGRSGPNFDRVCNFLTVADFECSIGIVGTGYWRAPEILSALAKREAVMDTDWEKADVYSFGMVCFEVVTGRTPFDGELAETRDHRDRVIHDNARPRLPSDLDGDVKHLITQCWDPTPSERPTFRKIVRRLQAIIWKKCQFKLFALDDEIPLPYRLARREEVYEYPMALDKSSFALTYDYRYTHVSLHFADDVVELTPALLSRLRSLQVRTLEFKLGRLC